MKKYLIRFSLLYLAVSLLFLTMISLTNQAVETMAQTHSGQKRQIIIIDAGHGGEDGGAISCTGRYESHVNLEIALRLNDLCHLLGYETKMIRTTDQSVYTAGKTLAEKKISDLRQRVQWVNETENGILISIHQNTFSDSKYSGAQVFYAKTEGSKTLAEAMQKTLSHVDVTNHRRVKEVKGVYLMQHIQKVGVLIECGFLSNPVEEAKLQSGEYQKKLCCAIVTAICTYQNT